MDMDVLMFAQTDNIKHLDKAIVYYVIQVVSHVPDQEFPLVLAAIQKLHFTKFFHQLEMDKHNVLINVKFLNLSMKIIVVNGAICHV